jgi:hypothetical protein
MRDVSAAVVAVVAALAVVLGVVGCGLPFEAEFAEVVKKAGGDYDGMAAGARSFDRPMSVGQVVAVTGKAYVTLQAVTRDAQGWPTPEAGRDLVVLDLTLVNRSGVDLDFQPQAQLRLIDQAKNQYPALGVKGFEPLRAGRRALAHGAPARGLVAFAVPVDAKGLGLTWAPIAPTVLVIQGLGPSTAMLPSH